MQPEAVGKATRNRVPRGIHQRNRIWWTRITAPDGRRKRVSLETDDLTQAKRRKEMLDQLADDPRARGADHMQRVFDGRLGVHQLYDAYVRGDLKGLRADSSDPDLSTHLPGWIEWLEKVGDKRGPVRERTREDYLRMLRSLMPEGRPFRRSRLTVSEVNDWLLKKVEGSSATRNRYFNALRSCVKYLRNIGVLDADPLSGMNAPRNSRPRDMYMPWTYVPRVLDAMPDDDRRSVIATSLGSGMEWSALERLTLANILSASERKLWAPGTKNEHRGRVVEVEPWAWPYVERQMRGKVGRAKLFNVTHASVLDAFYDAQVAIGWKDALPDGMTASQARKKPGFSLRGKFHTLHDCRHTYTVHRLTGEDGGERRDAGYIADQLGHGDTQMVVRVYGKYKKLIEAKTTDATKVEAEQKVG